MGKLSEKIIVVAGGSGLLGSAFVSAILENDGIAIVADIDGEKCQELVEKFSKLFPEKIIGKTLDISKKTSITSLIDQLSSKYQHIDAVINCAYPKNINFGRNLEMVSYEDFCVNINLHLGGYFLLMQQFALFFQKQGWGNIINMSSVYGTTVPKFEIYLGTNMTMPIEYAAIKAGLIQMTRNFSKYFKGHNIRINSLSPGGILDNQPENFLTSYNSFCNLKGMLEPKDLSGVLLFLLSDDSKYITGQNIIIDDGFSL